MNEKVVLPALLPLAESREAINTLFCPSQEKRLF
jgi:hypothetical protein